MWSLAPTFRFSEYRKGENDTKKGKSSISKARSYADIWKFWDEHDLSDFWEKTRRVKFDVVLERGRLPLSDGTA
jgi:hypothetical protein